MTLCPVALAITCSKCPFLSACPLKKFIGNVEEPVKKHPRDAKKTWPK